jgi:large subunit ribosomal protein L22e
MVRSNNLIRNPQLTSKRTFTIDCAKPAADGIFEDDYFAAFESFLNEHIKVNGKVGALGDKVKVTANDKKVQVTSYVTFSKRYFKYLTKRFLKKKQLRDWLRVVSTSKDRYELRYFNIQDSNEESEE